MRINEYIRAEGLAYVYNTSGEAAHLAALDQAFAYLSASIDSVWRDGMYTAQHPEQAQSLGLPIITYEGGHNIFGNCNDRDELRFLKDLHRHKRMGDMELKMLRKWEEHGGETAIGYTDVGAGGMCWGIWGRKEYAWQPGDSAAKWVGLMTWIDEGTGVRELTVHQPAVSPAPRAHTAPLFTLTGRTAALPAPRVHRLAPGVYLQHRRGTLLKLRRTATPTVDR